ncbi:MAG: class II aldolase/adducin family protein [Chloroflexota bacterium]|nr:class II aldolase/adducin family protein [Chloroflexota bacterium]
MKSDLINCGRILAEQKLVWGLSGNISVKTEPDVFFISAGGTDLGSLSDEHLIRCRIKDETWEGNGRPSMETGLHRGIYQVCEGAVAVIHSQPFYSTLVACSDMEIRTDFLPEAMAYLGKLERVPYFHAGSRELAEATVSGARNSKVLLLNNHGVVCWGASLDETLLITQTLEFCCRLLVDSSGSGIDLNYLGTETLEGFLRHLRDIGR